MRKRGPPGEAYARAAFATAGIFDGAGRRRSGVSPPPDSGAGIEAEPRVPSSNLSQTSRRRLARNLRTGSSWPPCVKTVHATAGDCCRTGNIFHEEAMSIGPGTPNDVKSIASRKWALNDQSGA